MISLLYPENCALFLTLVSYLGFFATGCVGFNELNMNTFNLNTFLISLTSFIFSIVFLLLELTYYLKYEFMTTFRNIYYLRFLLLIVVGSIILGITEVGLTFGLIAITSALVNLFIGIFADYDLEDDIDADADAN